MIDLYFIERLNLLKEYHPCSTASLDRTPIHNTRVGGAKKSRHLQGVAADLIFDKVSQIIPAARYARELGFGGIEADLRNNHLHVDNRTVLWHVVYTAEEKYTLDEYLLTLPSFSV